jgi:hypothetical protein
LIVAWSLALSLGACSSHPHPHPVGPPVPEGGSATPVEPPPDAAIEPAVPDHPNGPQTPQAPAQ